MKLLVPVDGSPYALKALETACDWAKSHPPAEVLILAAVPVLAELEEGRYIAEKLEKQAITALAQAKAKAKELGVSFSTLIAKGPSVAEEIVEAAKREQVDLIVIGSRGLGAKTTYFLGSTASKVVAYSPCSVMVIKGTD
uniref:Universal stress protein n=1 Tax=Desulfobacca acetoxidans TaxID=60893 RepID=A0A7C5ENH3_9BACT